MSVWTEHEKRIRRREQLARLNQWCLEHPWKARTWSLGIAIAIFELSEYLRLGLEALGRFLAR